MKNPNLSTVRRLAKSLDARGLVVLAFDRDRFAFQSYGATKAECDSLGAMVDQLAAMLEAGELEPFAGGSSPKPGP